MAAIDYDSYAEDSGSSGDYDDDEVDARISTNATIEGVVDKAFGTDPGWAQSLGVVFNDVTLVDGLVYGDVDKDTIKIFSWEDVSGFSLDGWVERGDEVSIDELADEIVAREYGQTNKTYELIGARIPEADDYGPETFMQDFTVTEDGVEIGDEVDVEDGPIPLPDLLQWHNGSDEYGVSASSKALVHLLTEEGGDLLNDTDDIQNWLNDTSGDNLLRRELEGRRLVYFSVMRDSNESDNQFKAPVLIDAQTGEEVFVSGSGDSEAVEEGRAADEGVYPAPVVEYINTGEALNLNEERAGDILDQLLEDDDNSLTPELVEEAGGRDELIGLVT